MSLMRKALNTAQLFVRPKEMRSRPIHMQYEPSSRCNLDCVHCETHKNVSRPSVATLDDFKTVYNAIKPLYLTLNGYGEPLLCKDLPDMIRYAVDNGATCNTTTNGVLLERSAQDLAQSGLSLLNISLDAATDRTYEAIRCKGAFDKVAAGIKAFDSARKTANKDIALRLSFVLQGTNFREAAEFAQLSADLGADMVLYQLVETKFMDYRADEVTLGMDLASVREELIRADQKLDALGMQSNVKWLLENLDKQWEQHILRKGGGNQTCRKPWLSVYVTVDGQVKPCCNFVTEDQEFGKIVRDRGWTSALNSPDFIAFRKALGKDIMPCKECQMCVPETFFEMAFSKRF